MTKPTHPLLLKLEQVSKAINILKSEFESIEDDIFAAEKEEALIISDLYILTNPTVISSIYGFEKVYFDVMLDKHEKVREHVNKYGKYSSFSRFYQKDTLTATYTHHANFLFHVPDSTGHLIFSHQDTKDSGLPIPCSKNAWEKLKLGIVSDELRRYSNFNFKQSK